jgi:hypothetical protein
MALFCNGSLNSVSIAGSIVYAPILKSFANTSNIACHTRLKFLAGNKRECLVLIYGLGGAAEQLSKLELGDIVRIRGYFDISPNDNFQIVAEIVERLAVSSQDRATEEKTNAR